MSCTDKVTVYNYIDFRALLKDLYERRKAENPNFSYRYISGKLGLKSSSYFFNVTRGKKKLSLRMIPEIIKVFHFSKTESEYFKLLVLFNQARFFAVKKEYLEKLSLFIHSKVKLISAHQYKYYEKWYYNAIRSLLGIYRFNGNYRELGSMLEPVIKVVEVKEALELLERLGFIKREDKNCLVPTDQLITTGDEAVSVAIDAFHHTVLDMAKDSIVRFPRSEREVSTLTLGISEENFLNIIKELKKFRRRILEMARMDKKPERVYQMNFQIFPLSKPVNTSNQQSRPDCISENGDMQL